MTILSLSGQEFMKKNITERSTNVDISVLPSGIYFVKVVLEETVQIVKIIKE